MKNILVLLILFIASFAYSQTGVVDIWGKKFELNSKSYSDDTTSSAGFGFFKIHKTNKSAFQVNVVFLSYLDQDNISLEFRGLSDEVIKDENGYAYIIELENNGVIIIEFDNNDKFKKFIYDAPAYNDPKLFLE